MAFLDFLPWRRQQANFKVEIEVDRGTKHYTYTWKLLASRSGKCSQKDARALDQQVVGYARFIAEGASKPGIVKATKWF